MPSGFSKPILLMQGKYVLGDCIGEGGMGRVYRARQPALDRLVAVKVMHAALAENLHVARHFQTEAVAAAGIVHPNSVAVLDYGQTDEGTPFLVMELVDGHSLSRLVRDEAPLDPARAVSITVQILDALEEAHRAGIVHADVKSDNVLVERERHGRDQVKLVDFGLARIAREPTFPDDVDFISGTPDYMAPEVIEGASPSPASDIYATGTMLYELLTGSTPFGGGTHVEILQRHLHDIVVPPSLRTPQQGIPQHIESAIMRALAKNPAHRFSSAAAFANALTIVATPAVPLRVRRATPARMSPDEVSTLVMSQNERSDVVAAEMDARRRIGKAMIRGNAAEMSTEYLALAEILRSNHRPRAAIRELEEALDVLPGAAPSILMALIPLYIAIGDHRSATLATRALEGRDTLTMSAEP